MNKQALVVAPFTLSETVRASAGANVALMLVAWYYSLTVSLAYCFLQSFILFTHFMQPTAL